SPLKPDDARSDSGVGEQLLRSAGATARKTGPLAGTCRKGVPRIDVMRVLGAHELPTTQNDAFLWSCFSGLHPGGQQVYSQSGGAQYPALPVWSIALFSVPFLFPSPFPSPKACYDGSLADCPSPQEDDIVKTAILVEKLGKKKYRASTSQPIALESEGRSA